MDNCKVYSWFWSVKVRKIYRRYMVDFVDYSIDCYRVIFVYGTAKFSLKGRNDYGARI